MLQHDSENPGLEQPDKLVELPKDIHIEGSLTYSDMVADSRLSGCYREYLYFTAYRVGTFLSCLAILIYAFFSVDLFLTLISTLAVCFSFSIAYHYIYCDLKGRRNARKREREKVEEFSNDKTTISNEGIYRVIGSDRHTWTGKATWDYFQGHRLSDRIALLYYDFPRGYTVVARSMFKNDDWNLFVSFISARLPKK